MSYRTIDKGQFESVVMTYLTPKEEKILDKVGGITLKRADQTFLITTKSILAYGEIDFNNDSEDMEYLSNLSFLDHLFLRGVCIPARYNYEKHCCYSRTRKPEYFDTTRPEVLCKYVHAMLGKPQITLIFKNKSGI